MDEGDSPIDLADLVLTRFPSLEEFFKKQEPSMASFIMFADDKTLEGLWHLVGEYANDFTNEIYSEWEANDDGFHRWQMEYAEEKGYMTADGDVDWDKVHDDEHFGYDQYNDDAQRMLGDVYEISQWKYFEIREFAQRMDETGDTEGTPTLTDLDEMFAAAVESEVSNYADLIAEHIHAKIWVRTNFNGAEQYKRDGGRILSKVGEYTVGVVRENRRGTNEAIDRRGFLRGMLGAGAAAAGLTATDAEAAKKKKQQQATQQYNPNVVGSGIRVDPNYKEPADPIVAKAAQKERELAQYRQQTQQAPQQKPTQAQQVATATKSDPRYSANSQLFTARLNQVASALRIDPADLLAVMKFETMGKLTPDVSNRMNAVGLIQFMPSTAKDLGTTTEALKNMSAVEQLEWVYKYYKRQGLRPNSSIFEIYLMTLFPAIAKSKLPDNHVVAADPKSTNPKIAKAAKLPVVHSADISRGYMWRENPAFKVKGKDYYTVADIKNRIKQFASRAQ
jgi:hypothetical protein